MLSVQQNEAIIKAISSARKITYQSLTNTTKDLRKNIRSTGNPGMKMNKLKT